MSDHQSSKEGNEMWGGRFSAKPSDVMEAINASIDVDQRMAREDIEGSRAHVTMLAKQGIVAEIDRDQILAGLDQVEAEIANDKFEFSKALEDIHMNIEARLKDIIGEAAGRLHTARSRNDQVATDFKLWVRAALKRNKAQIKNLIEACLDQAEAHAGTLMPGFTHLQTAQPVTFGHHMMAYVEMLYRDYKRMSQASENLNECPLGAAALAGTGFDIDRNMTAEALGFDRPTANSLDSVSDRDFALEAMAANAICAGHLSRLAEELVVWASAQFAFVNLPDSYSTGSSIMPQKRNPDAAELVRAKTGRTNGTLLALLTVMKGLPLAYSKDMQEDKALTFESFDALHLSLTAMTGMIENLKVNEVNMRKAAGHGFSTATDLADWLVRELGLPFREAHHVTGCAVKMAENKGLELSDLTLPELQSLHQEINDKVYDVLSVDASVNSRTSYGGTAPVNVKQQLDRWRKILPQLS